MEFSDRFYKSTEVADILGVSLRTLYRYMDSAKIQSVQLPSGRHRFTKQQIEDFLYSNGSGGLGQFPNTQANTNQQPEDRVYVDTGKAPFQPSAQSQNPQQPNPVTSVNTNKDTTNQVTGGINQQVWGAPEQQSQSPQDQASTHPTVPNLNAQQPTLAETETKTAEDDADDLDAELEELLASLEDDSESSDNTPSTTKSDQTEQTTIQP